MFQMKDNLFLITKNNGSIIMPLECQFIIKFWFMLVEKKWRILACRIMYCDIYIIINIREFRGFLNNIGILLRATGL